jgi:hypothetical protein
MGASETGRAAGWLAAVGRAGASAARLGAADGAGDAVLKMLRKFWAVLARTSGDCSAYWRIRSTTVAMTAGSNPARRALGSQYTIILGSPPITLLFG